MITVKVIKSCTRPIKIIRTSKIVKVVSPKPAPLNIVPFTFTATAGQTAFTLPSTPVVGGIFIVSINAGPQDQAGGDFTIATNILTLAEGVDLNDKVYGFYEAQ